MGEYEKVVEAGKALIAEVDRMFTNPRNILFAREFVDLRAALASLPTTTGTCPTCYSDKPSVRNRVGEATHGVDPGEPCWDKWHATPPAPLDALSHEMAGLPVKPPPAPEATETKPVAWACYYCGRAEPERAEWADADAPLGTPAYRCPTCLKLQERPTPPPPAVPKCLQPAGPDSKPITSAESDDMLDDEAARIERWIARLDKKRPGYIARLHAGLARSLPSTPTPPAPEATETKPVAWVVYAHHQGSERRLFLTEALARGVADKWNAEFEGEPPYRVVPLYAHPPAPVSPAHDEVARALLKECADIIESEPMEGAGDILERVDAYLARKGGGA